MRIVKKIIKWFLILLCTCFVALNFIAYKHAYNFTHYGYSDTTQVSNPQNLNKQEKLDAILNGVHNPRPENFTKPQLPYETIQLQSNKKIECWYIKPTVKHKKDSIAGTVIVCHGYSGHKSTMLGRAYAFAKLRYNSLMLDFMGSGGSQGNITTIGYYEAEQVKTAYDYLQKNGVKNIYLFGTSMGAAAIMKAIKDYDLKPKGIILECPFGSMYEAVKARFKYLNAPSFPMAELLVFWGGAQHKFWGFSHNPTNYAKYIKTPTLLLYGNQDKVVTYQEIEKIYNSLSGEKQLKIFDNTGHENFLEDHRKEIWLSEVSRFFRTNIK
jgi:hypothetical protein